MPEADWQQFESLIPAIRLHRTGNISRELAEPDLGCDFPRTGRSHEHTGLFVFNETSDFPAESLIPENAPLQRSSIDAGPAPGQ